MLNGSRKKFLDILYRRLPRDSVKPGKVVVDVQTHDTGVRVLLEDGSVEEASMVIGADGVNSTLRGIVQKSSSAKKGPVSGVSDEHEHEQAELDPIVASYQSLLGTSKPLTGMPRNMFWEMRGRGITAQVWSSDEEVLWIVFRRLPTLNKLGRTYTEAEAEAMAADCAGLVPVPGSPFRDLWDARTWSRLVDQEEGFVLHGAWHHRGGGRVVLVGDCVHKMTSNAGFGLNMGVQGVVSLVNTLRSCLLATNFTPDAAVLGQVFERYRADCAGDGREAVAMSRYTTDLATWQTVSGFFVVILPCVANWGASVLEVTESDIFGSKGAAGNITQPSPRKIYNCKEAFANSRCCSGA